MLNNRLSLLVLFAPSLLSQANLGTTTLINSFETPQDLKVLSTLSASFTQVTQDATNGQYALQVNFQLASFAFLNFRTQLAGLPPWNWSDQGGLAFDVCNPTGQTVNVHVLMTDATPLNGSDKTHVADWAAPLAANSCGTMLVPFQNPPSPLSMGMQAPPPLPGYILMQYQDGTVDFSHVYEFDFYLNNPPSPTTLIFDNVRVFNANESSQLYTGIVDAYGQFAKVTWPGKVSSDTDLTAQAKAEAALPLPASGSFDKYGGILALPSVATTGYFRTTQDAAGKWWLVTPLGHLFFATGIVQVPYLTTPSTLGRQATDTQGREQMFTFLPGATDPLAAFNTAPVSYVPPASLGINNSLGAGFDFYSANLYRKYGSSYLASWTQSTVDRFTRWGINHAEAIASFFYSAVGSLGQRIPYAVFLTYSAGNFAHVNSSGDYWGPIPDPFDPAFALAVDSNFAQQIPSFVTEPYLVGYYSDNELSWAVGSNDSADNNHYSLIYGVLNSGASQPAKQVFVQTLMSEYTDVAKLNQSWLTNFASWNDLLATAYAAPVPLPTSAMRSDFSAFLLSFAQQYFRIISTTIKKYDPHHLYLGAKFAGSEFAIEPWQACAQLCDVVSFDDYNLRLDPAIWGFINQYPKPAILAEFSFGSTDRGMFSGSALVSSQAARALFYGLKVQDAATDSSLVGVNWYQYLDDPVAGTLSDGSNIYQGFVPVSDTPYPELTNAATVVNSVVPAWRTLPNGTQSAAPALTSISPSSLAVGSTDALLTLTGSGFAMNSVAQWNGTALQTLYISGTQLWALLPAAYLMTAARASVTVSTPAPGGGTSNTVPFTAGNPVLVQPAISGITDAWNYTAGLAPGSWVTVVGTNMTSASPQTWILSGSQPLPTTVGGLTVTFNGAPAALYYVSATQINALVPASVAPGPVQVVVQSNGVSSTPFTITATETQPAVYAPPSADGSTFFVTAALQGTGFLVGNSTTDPRVIRGARPGDILDLYMIGLGATADPTHFITSQSFSGAYPLSAVVTATVGGETAQVLFAGLTSPGLYLVRVAIPSDLAAGAQPIQISAGGAQTRSSLVLVVSAAAPNLIQNGSFESTLTGNWGSSIDTTTGVVATIQRTTSTAEAGSYSVQIDVSTAATPSSSANTCVYCAVQLIQTGLSIKQGNVYQLQFWAKADTSRTMNLNIIQAGAPYGNEGLATTVALGGAWQQYVIYFQASATDPNGRVTFFFGDQAGNTWLDNVSLQ